MTPVVQDESYWIAERPSYYVQTGAAYENPYGMPRAEIEKYIRNHTAENTAQVIFGKYVDNSGLVFTGELVTQLFADDAGTPPINEELWWDHPRWKQGALDLEHRPTRQRYHIGVDLARKKDSTVITVLDCHQASIERPARVVYWRRTNRVAWSSIYAEIGRAAWLFPGQMLVDATGGQGDIVMEELETRFYCPYHHASFAVEQDQCPKHGRKMSEMNAGIVIPGRGIVGRPPPKSDPRDYVGCSKKWWLRLTPDGYIFSTNSKADLINNTQSLLGRAYDEDDIEKPFGLVRSPPIIPLQEELGEYAWDDKKLSTDSVFSFALACWSGLEDLPVASTVGSVHGDE